MWTRYDLKMNAQTAFKRNYWTCVAASLVIGVLSGSMFAGSTSGIKTTVEMQHNNPYAYENYSAYSYNSGGTIFGGNPIISMLLVGIVIMIGVLVSLYNVFVGNVISVGGCRYFMENREHETKAAKVFYGFQNGRYGNVIKTMFFRDLFIFLWTLVLIVPGIIKSYSYRFVPYILSENPQMDRKRALELSQQMMDGHKMEAFVLELSFFGWFLLSAMTCGLLSIFYVNPYVHATFAEFYVAIRTESIGKGLVGDRELPGYYAENV